MDKTKIRNVKNRIVRVTKKAWKPLVIGTAIVSAYAIGKLVERDAWIPLDFEDDSITIEEHDDGSFTVRELTPESEEI